VCDPGQHLRVYQTVSSERDEPRHVEADMPLLPVGEDSGERLDARSGSVREVYQWWEKLLKDCTICCHTLIYVDEAPHDSGPVVMAFNVLPASRPDTPAQCRIVDQVQDVLRELIGAFADE